MRLITKKHLNNKMRDVKRIISNFFSSDFPNKEILSLLVRLTFVSIKTLKELAGIRASLEGDS